MPSRGSDYSHDRSCTFLRYYRNCSFLVNESGPAHLDKAEVRFELDLIDQSYDFPTERIII